MICAKCRIRLYKLFHVCKKYRDYFGQCLIHRYIISLLSLTNQHGEGGTVLHIWWHPHAKGNIQHKFCFSCTGFLYVSDHCTRSGFTHSKYWVENTTLSKWTDPKVYPSTNAAIWVLLNIEGTKHSCSNVRR